MNLYYKKLFNKNKKQSVQINSDNIPDKNLDFRKMKIGVCIKAKDEQKIICDWVRYYLKLDFDKIIIYDNLSNPPIQETLSNNNLLDNKIEIIIDSYTKGLQTPLYENCINNNKDLDWLLCCDTDEFLYIKNGNIKEFLSNFSDDTCTILINWLVFGSSGNLTYDYNKTIFEQFTKRETYNNFWNIFVKSFIRPKLINNALTNHIIYNENYKIKSVYNKELKIEHNTKCDMIDYNLNDNTPVVLVHYMTLDIDHMLSKGVKYKKCHYIDKESTKYSLEWYSNTFKDHVEDLRMI